MFEVVFYETVGGNKIVKDWLQSFAKPDRAVLGEDLRTVQFGFPMGLPLCRPLGNGLWEVRSTLPMMRAEARMIFYQDNDTGALVVVHGFIKKTQKTSKRDIDIALHRKRESSP